MSLTEKQYQALMFIKRSIDRRGFSPTLDEIMVDLGQRSKSGTHRVLTGLEERGFIRRRPGQWRAIEIVRMPGDEIGYRIAADRICDRMASESGDDGFIPVNAAQKIVKQEMSR